MKKVYLELAGRMHSLYREFIDYPPEGYEFITEGASWDKVSKSAADSGIIYSVQKRFLRHIIPVNLTKAYLERFKKIPQGTELTFSVGHLVFRREPWVVQIEVAHQLAGYRVKYLKRYKRLIENTLASQYCKGIICWSDFGMKTMLANLDCQRFKHKLETIPLTAHSKDFTKKYHEDKVRLLFVGSINIPKEFEITGGKEALEAFMYLRNKYDNLELVIRSDMPDEIKRKYSGIDNVRIIDDTISWEEVEQIYQNTDILLYPTYMVPGMKILEAMSYEMPFIITDTWGNPEMDGKAGFIIKKSERVPFYVGNYEPVEIFKWESLIKDTDLKMVQEIVEKASVLIENKELRRKMGKAGRKEIETGKFSIKRRNEKLKRIFDEATA